MVILLFINIKMIKLNINKNQPKFSTYQKKKLMTKLVEAVSFENFLHTKYVGQKRF